MHHKKRHHISAYNALRCTRSRQTDTHDKHAYMAYRSQTVWVFNFTFIFISTMCALWASEYRVCIHRVCVACRVCTWLHVALALRFAQYPHHHLNSTHSLAQHFVVLFFHQHRTVVDSSHAKEHTLKNIIYLHIAGTKSANSHCWSLEKTEI